MNIGVNKEYELKMAYKNMILEIEAFLNIFVSRHIVNYHIYELNIVI